MKNFFLLAIFFAIKSTAQPGTQFSGFKTTGTVTTFVSAYNASSIAVGVQSNGRIISAGITNNYNGEFALAAYLPDGKMDHSFGTKSITQTNLGRNSHFASSMLLQADDKIILAGEVIGQRTEACIVRYTANGQLDNSFNKTGFLLLNLGQSTYTTKMLLQSDGKILLLGYVSSDGYQTPFIARFNADGSSDISFGTKGIYKLTEEGRLSDMALLADGKIVATGYSGQSKSMTVWRFSKNGQPDKTFNSKAFIELNIGANYNGKSILTLPNGRLLLVCNTDLDNLNFITSAAIRLLPDGKMDTSFGAKGLVRFKDNVNNMNLRKAVAQPDGKIVLMGNYDGKRSRIPAIVRMTENGKPDLTFGIQGVVSISASPNHLTRINAVALQKDGKIVVAGSAISGQNRSDFFLARIKTNGLPDKSETVTNPIAPTPTNPAPAKKMTVGEYAAQYKAYVQQNDGAMSATLYKGSAMYDFRFKNSIFCAAKGHAYLYLFIPSAISITGSELVQSSPCRNGGVPQRLGSFTQVQDIDGVKVYKAKVIAAEGGAKCTCNINFEVQTNASQMSEIWVLSYYKND